MKIRNGFVSNSSSSSFVIAKSFISPEQITKLQDWLSTQSDEDDCLSLSIEENYVSCTNTYYCEPSAVEFLKELGIDRKFIYSEYN